MKTRNSIWSPNEIDLIKTILIHTLEQEMRRDVRVMEVKGGKSLNPYMRRSEQAMSKTGTS